MWQQAFKQNLTVEDLTMAISVPDETWLGRRARRRRRRDENSKVNNKKVSKNKNLKTCLHLGVVHKWRHVIFEPPPPIVTHFITKALLLSSQNHWPLPSASACYIAVSTYIGSRNQHNDFENLMHCGHKQNKNVNTKHKRAFFFNYF